MFIFLCTAVMKFHEILLILVQSREFRYLGHFTAVRVI